MAAAVMNDPAHAEVITRIADTAHRHPVESFSDTLWIGLAAGLTDNALSPLDAYGREDYWPDVAELLGDVFDFERRLVETPSLRWDVTMAPSYASAAS